MWIDFFILCIQKLLFCTSLWLLHLSAFPSELLILFCVFVFARSACLFVIILNSKTTWGLNRLPCNLVAQRLAGDDGHLLTDPLVNMEVVAQTGVVLLDDHPGRLLHCLGPDPPLERGKNNTTTNSSEYRYSNTHTLHWLLHNESVGGGASNGNKADREPYQNFYIIIRMIFF